MKMTNPRPTVDATDLTIPSSRTSGTYNRFGTLSGEGLGFKEGFCV